MSDMPFFAYSGITFHYREQGSGLPFILQHGLGGDTDQTFGIFNPPDGVRMVTLDCRGHGQTTPLGSTECLNFNQFADDILAMMAHLGIVSAVIGGISMGCAIALKMAVRFPQRISGLVLSRPAWLADANPGNLAVYDLIHQLILCHGTNAGLKLFLSTPSYQEIASESPDAAASLIGQFTNPRAAETVAKLHCIPADTPIDSLQALGSIRVPTLILASKQDPIHPYEYAIRLARAIPNAQMYELTPKSQNRALHTAEFGSRVGDFLRELA
jgi:pimeloyl-ACP methyl ester carboxylesterase